MAVPFIEIEDGVFRVADEAKSLLRGIKGKIAVVAVAGLYRTGKSFLLNLLIGGGGDQSNGGVVPGGGSGR